MCAGFGVWGLPVDVACAPARDPAGEMSFFAQAGENKVWAETVQAEVKPPDRSIFMMTSIKSARDSGGLRLLAIIRTIKQALASE